MTSMKTLYKEGRQAELDVKTASLGSRIGVISVVLLVGAWSIAAGIMLVSFGLWGWVVWPAVVTFWLGRIAKATTQAAKQIKEAKEKNAFANAGKLASAGKL